MGNIENENHILIVILIGILCIMTIFSYIVVNDPYYEDLENSENAYKAGYNDMLNGSCGVHDYEDYWGAYMQGRGDAFHIDPVFVEKGRIDGYRDGLNGTEIFDYDKHYEWNVSLQLFGYYKGYIEGYMEGDENGYWPTGVYYVSYSCGWSC